MMEDTSLIVSDVSKVYHRYNNLFERVIKWFGLSTNKTEKTKVLNRINLTVAKGECIALVGENGAGKSTLLKIIAKTLTPSEGQVHTSGKVAAILELGLGFNPELTGKENIFLVGSTLGLSRKQILELEDWIINFSELGEYYDRPLRIYSSGMQARLAFSVATAYKPDILIIDEALSVGDTYFQHKSFARIKELRKQGTTLLFVSHDKGAVQLLCDRALLIENGTVIKDGAPEEVFDFYNALISDKEELNIEQKKSGSKVVTSSGTKEVEFEEINLINQNGIKTDTVKVGENITVELLIRVNESIEQLVLGFGVKDRLGQMLFGTNTMHTSQTLNNLIKGEVRRCKVNFVAAYGVGSYSLHLSMIESESHIEKNFQWLDNAFVFNVVNHDKEYFIGSQWNPVTFKFDTVKQSRSFIKDSINIVDVGCRWGITEKFKGLKEAYFIGFDPDEEECNKLQKLSDSQGINSKFVPYALDSSSKNRNIYITEEPACSSFYKPISEIYKDYSSLKCITPVKESSISCITLDDWCENNHLDYIDYLKIDVQGAELDVLKGATKVLQSVNILELEVEFNRLYENQCLFHEVDAYLRKQGFVLWKFNNLVHYSKVNKVLNEKEGIGVYFNDELQRVNYTSGQLYWADAIYIRAELNSGDHNNTEEIKRLTPLLNVLGLEEIVAI